MAEQLQELLEKIQKEGVDKAKAEAERIVSEAKARAAQILKSADEQAEQIRASAKEDAAAFEARAKESVRQAARDTVAGVEKSVTDMLCKVLAKNVDAALTDPAVVSQIILDAVKSACAGGSAVVDAGSKIADSVRAQLASQGVSGVTVVTDEMSGGGFSVRVNGGAVEHSFKGDVVTGELAKLLRPALAELVRG